MVRRSVVRDSRRCTANACRSECGVTGLERPDNRCAFVANAAGNSVSVIEIDDANPNSFTAHLDMSVGPGGEFSLAGLRGAAAN